jgi:guanine deaminase
MTLYRAMLMDTPDSPFDGGRLRVEDQGAVVVSGDGTIRARGPYSRLRSGHPDEEVVDLSGGMLLPGLVDTHVHFPQVRVIGGLGLPLLDWLDRCALPEEARMADPGYAAGVAEEFVDGLLRAGTTTSLVFGAHFAPAVDAFFAAAASRGLRASAGLVLGDRLLREELYTTPDRAHAESMALAARWHGRGRLRYAVTPRFSLATSADLLQACAAVLDSLDGALFTTHLNENPAEIETVRRLFPDSRHYLDTYHRFGLVGPTSVFAHNVHPDDAELELLAGQRSAVAHCPSSNCSLGSGLFPMRRHVERGVPVALGTDVGAGPSFSVLREGLQAYFVQSLLGADGWPLTAAHLLYLATLAGARAVGLDEQVGDLSPGKQFDAVWIRPEPGSTLEVAVRRAAGDEDALSKVFALATTADVRGVWIGGDRVR